MNILKQDVKDYLIQQLQDDVGLDNDINDLHHYLINQDYFIIGYYQARKWLEKEFGSCKTSVIITFHPAFLMRQPAQKKLSWIDLKMIRDKKSNLNI